MCGCHFVVRKRRKRPLPVPDAAADRTLVSARWGAGVGATRDARQSAVPGPAQQSRATAQRVEWPPNGGVGLVVAGPHSRYFWPLILESCWAGSHAGHRDCTRLGRLAWHATADFAVCAGTNCTRGVRYDYQRRGLPMRQRNLRRLWRRVLALLEAVERRDGQLPPKPRRHVPRSRTPAEWERKRHFWIWFIGFCDEHGRGPSNREICQAMGWRSTRAAQNCLYAVRKLGWLDWTTNGQRREFRIVGAAPGVPAGAGRQVAPAAALMVVRGANAICDTSNNSREARKQRPRDSEEWKTEVQARPLDLCNSGCTSPR